MKQIILTTITILAFTLMSCKTINNTNKKTIYISAETKPCSTGLMETQCMLVKWTKDQKEWEYFYSSIQGFKYEIGNEYELIIKEEKIKNPPADGSSIKYTLIKEISKRKMVTTSSQKLKKPFTSTHIFTAFFDGINFHQCLGRTALCPDKCGQSGNIANFRVKEYKNLIVNGQAGTEKLKTYQILISDFNKKDINEPFTKDIKTLKKGDLVTIHVEYVYNTTLSSVKTVENIISISKN
ncbi:DUF4377 domain-containing protein [Flavobacterium oreochromis]|nr:DUF4377 domain-containing protein [Flavobacterium oreochromis]